MAITCIDITEINWINFGDVFAMENEGKPRIIKNWIKLDEIEYKLISRPSYTQPTVSEKSGNDFFSHSVERGKKIVI